MKKEKTAKKSGKLSATDRLILDSYRTTMEGLAAYCGEAFEFVLHDITDFDHSVIKIINGSHSGRKEGAPITDFALSMLEKIRADGTSGTFMCYTSKSKYGRPVKSATIVITGGRKKAIGLLCVNFYLDSPLTSVLRSFSPDPGTDYVTENFSNDSDELIMKALEKAKSAAGADASVPSRLKNKEIVTILYHQGVFRLKNAVRDVSADLGISKSTVYLHIRELEKA